MGIAVDAHDTLYVTTADPPSQIEEYRSGQSTPFRTITDQLSYPVASWLAKTVGFTLRIRARIRMEGNP